MSAATIAALKTEISQLEKELDKHRRALQILEGEDRSQATQPKKPTQATQPKKPTQATQPKKPTQATQPSRPKPSGSAQAALTPPIKVLIAEALKATAPQKLTPVEIVQQISKNGHTINLHNIHSRLSEMVKTKTVQRKDGQYWV